MRHDFLQIDLVEFAGMHYESAFLEMTHLALRPPSKPGSRDNFPPNC
jgi:hypothetical protein